MPELPVLSVTELTRQLKDLVEANFPYVCVEGELSNVTRAGSGHVYFTLKDDRASVRGVVWSRTAARLRFDPTDGLAVLATGPIEIYAARGSYQLIVEHLVPQGLGPLELAFRQLHEKLQAAGLFDPSHKKPLPPFPRRIAIITSPSGAAIRDMLKVLSQRWRLADILILPVAVQGATAAGQITAAFEKVKRLRGVDVVIAGRGGGSLEDLWPFNEEIVARAIYDCPIPVISAVGHEIDVSISDLVADCRAATPTEAGQLVAPDGAEVAAHLAHTNARLRQALLERVRTARYRLEAVSNRRVLQRPLDRIHQQTDRLDRLADRLSRAMRNSLDRSRARLTQHSRQLDALSPLRVLGRGYSITEQEDGTVVRSVTGIQSGALIRTRLGDGTLTSRVTETKEGQP